MQIKGFKPVTDGKARVLILGTMPGVTSLKQNEYYAHPGNVFWRIMSELCGFDPVIAYAQRLDCLKQSGVLLWDVLAKCYREGSLDSSIKKQGLMVNNFNGLFSQSPELRLIVFNGKKAESLFYKLFKPLPESVVKMDMVSLPSTSPANARLNYQQKLEQWQQIKVFLK